MAKIVGNLVPEDDYLHELGPEPNFNESAYYNFFDSTQNLGGWFRIGNRANEGNAERSVCLYLPDGRVFDATHRRGAPLRFRLDRNEVIEGLDAAAAQLSAGERAKVRMGCDRAYGDRGFPYLVPPKTALVFDLEMLGAES